MNRLIVWIGMAALASISIAGNTYYVAASGDNLNDGLSPTSAWRDVDVLNGKTFGPGDQILFNRGNSFPGRCVLSGSGSASEPILVGAYGTGDKPHLTARWNWPEIFLLSSDNEYIEFRDLHLSNHHDGVPGIKERFGIHILPSIWAGEISRLHFLNLYFSDIIGANGYAEPDDNHRSRGIYAETVDNDSSPTRFNDFLVEECSFSDIDGLGAQLRDFSQDISDKKVRGTGYFPTVGFVFQNNYGTNIYRNLLQIRGTKDALVQYNTMDTTVEGSAFWPFACDGTLVQYNLFMNLFAHDADAYVCHFDFNCINTLMQYNIGYNVEGGLIEYIVNSTWSGFQENGIARYNIGIDVGWRNKPNGAGILLSGRVTGGQFYNNTIIQQQQPMENGISFNNWGGEWPNNNTIYNNIFYAAGANTVLFDDAARFDDLGNVLSHNLYYGNISPPATDVHSFTDNPLFSNPAGSDAKDFKVLFGSAAIGKGLVISGNGGIDYFSNSVSAVTAPTLGAHEYQSDAVIDSDGDKMPDLWESTYSLNPVSAADAGLDGDTDQLVNLAEFALGGDPTNGGDTGHPQSWSRSGGDMIYIYPRRIDSGLNYYLETCSNLISNDWTNSGYMELPETGPINADFETVTNTIPISGNQGFIRLGIEAP